MRFQLTLIPIPGSDLLPANYQYPLSAAIYRIIRQADEKYSAFLHDKGYRFNGKSFKLFSFSDLRVPFRNQGDRLLITGSQAKLTITFHIDEAATHFIAGLFMNQQLEVADKISQVKFSVSQVELLNDPLTDMQEEDPVIILHTLSPLVVGRKNAKGNYDFIGPADASFADSLIYNWLEKYRSVNGEAPLIENLKGRITVDVLTSAQEIRSRLITIKAFTPEQTKIRGFTKFRMCVKAPKPLLALALDAGMGLYNAQGMGCVGVA